MTNKYKFLKKRFLEKKALITFTTLLFLGTAGIASYYFLSDLGFKNQASEANPLDINLVQNPDSVSATAIVGQELGTVTISNMPNVSTCDIVIGSSTSTFAGANYDSNLDTCTKDFNTNSLITSLDTFDITIGADNAGETFFKTVAIKPILPESAGGNNFSTNPNFQYANLQVEYLQEDGITTAEGSILHKDWKNGDQDLLIKVSSFEPAGDLNFQGIQTNQYTCNLYFRPGNTANFTQVKSNIDYDPSQGCEFLFESSDAGSANSNYIYEFKLDILDSSDNIIYQKNSNYGFNFAGVVGGG